MRLSPEELARNRLNPDTLEYAVQQIKTSGYVIFERVLPPDFVQELHDAYMEVFNEYLADPDPTFGTNHYRVYLPFRPPFNDERIINSPFATPILEALLGEDMVCHYFASNTAAPGSDYQPVHSDMFPLFPAYDIKPPTYHMVLNVPLVDSTAANGAMHVWPGGTHLNTLPRDQMTKLAEVMPHIHCEMPAGSILLRDGRMWHRGVPNTSNAPRPNIALVYNRSWIYGGKGRIGIPQATYDALSERAKRIFRQEYIGAELDTPFSHRRWLKK